MVTKKPSFWPFFMQKTSDTNSGILELRNCGIDVTESLNSSILFQKIFYLFEVCHMVGSRKR